MKLGLRVALGFLFLWPAVGKAAITDTIHVSHYNITVDTIDFGAHTIKAVTEVTVHAKMNGVATIALSLNSFTVDSVSSSGAPLLYSYSANVLRITAPSVLNTGDSVVIRVRYHGVPWTDASYGGVYWSGSYMYNMGVCITTDPHSAGKAWFPCVDEFLEHSTYEFHVTTPAGNKAFCNGVLESSVTNPNTSVTWNWQMNQPITTYLACIAVAPFYTINRTYQGIPVQIACAIADTAVTLLNFQHLDSVLMFYIKCYGPYPFDKVGYVVVPFNSGAMEHATSITIGKPFVTGSSANEELWAHELSHLWWGDKVTCATEEDMWLNEGWAHYHEFAYREFIYGKAAYMSAARSVHHSVLQFTNYIDNAYFALNNVPHSSTYANTVYRKGGDVTQSLRRFMGDSAFFAACKYHLSQQAWGNSSSAQLRDNFAASSGISLTDYFNTIVFTPGFPHVSLDSFVVAPNGGNYDVTIYTREKQKGNTLTFALPVEFTFSDATRDTSVMFTVNAPANSFTVTLPFVPLWAAVDRNERLSDAIVDYEVTVKDTGVVAFTETNVSINVRDTGSTHSLIRVEHNYVKPDPFKVPHTGIRLSDYHYYKVDGLFSNGFYAHGTFNYDGGTNYTNGFLDHTLLTGNAREDSLLIYYRANSGEEWVLVNGFTINYSGAHTDRRGSITVDTLKRGEYVFAVKDFTIVGMDEVAASAVPKLTVYPNPASGICHIGFHLASPKGMVRITDVLGKEVFSREVSAAAQSLDWNTHDARPGFYLVQLIVDDAVVSENKLVVTF